MWICGQKKDWSWRHGSGCPWCWTSNENELSQREWVPEERRTLGQHQRLVEEQGKSDRSGSVLPSAEVSCKASANGDPFMELHQLSSHTTPAPPTPAHGNGPSLLMFNSAGSLTTPMRTRPLQESINTE